MADVKATVLKPFIHKGKQYEKDEEISLAPKAAATYAKIDYIELDKAAEAKVEKAVAPAKAAKK